jgi:hypothetical protein
MKITMWWNSYTSHELINWIQMHNPTEREEQLIKRYEELEQQIEELNNKIAELT